MRPFPTIGIGLLVAFATSAGAQQFPEWQYPAVESYGPVVPVPDASAEIEGGEDYQVVFNITEGSPGDGRVSPDLALVARLVNLLALSAMDPEQSDIVAVVHEAATSAVIEDSAFQARFGSPNPNAALIEALEAEGVEVVVCGQAVTGAGFPFGAVMEPVDISLSAMTELAKRQLEGYALIPS